MFETKWKSICVYFPADRISTVEFDKSGDYVAVGDRGGRIVIFETKDGKNVRISQFYYEFIFNTLS